jgi:iron complex outermembrane receptor protein
VTARRLLMLAGAAAICASAGAHAEDGTAGEQEQAAAEANAAQSSAGNRAAVPEIVVTAERRATNLQDTPLSIVAVTGDIAEAKGIEDLQDLSHYTPNLSITPSRGSGSSSANFVIRGISGGGGASGERGVGLYVDGVYMPRTSGAVLRVLDIDRIEVLRGPQGTLFGRNSTGGAIRIFSKQPTGQFEGYVEGTLGNFDHHDAIGLINVPLGENVALRVQGAYLHKDGFVSRGTQKLGAQTDYVGRAQLRVDLTPDFTATFGLLYNRSKANATPYVVQEFDLGPGVQAKPGFPGIQGNYGDLLNDAFKAAGQAPLAAYNDPRIVKGAYAAPDVCLIDDFNPDYDSACDQYNNDKYWQGDMNLHWKLGDNVSVQAITGLSQLKHRAVTDWELIGAEMRYDNIASKVFYQELQLNASLFDSKIDVVIGGSYFHENSDTPGDDVWPGSYVLNRRTTSSYPATAGNPPNSDGGLYYRSISYTKYKADSWGLFGSATWHITDRLNLTGGLRQAWDHKDYLQSRFEPPATPYQAPDFRVEPGTTATTVTASKPFKALDYRATLDYHFTPEIMAYATMSKAYKAGSFSYTIQSWTPTNNATGANQSPLVSAIPNEKLVNYEAGLRMELFDRHLRLNPTGFIMHYTDRQAAIRVNCGTGALANIPAGSAQCPVGFIPLLQDQGDATIRGIEVDGQVVITPDFTLDGSLGLTDYTLKNVPPGTTHLFPDAPTPTYNIGANYTLRTGGGSATFNISYAYVGKQSVYPDDSEDSGYILPSYGLVNARLMIGSDSLPMTVTFYANNLLDEVYATYAQRFGRGFWATGGPAVGLNAPVRSMLSVVRGRPREFGAAVKYSF